MSHFEEIGVDYQYNARNAEMAQKLFGRSCHKCSTQGKHIDCDKCAISAAHNLIMTMFKINS